jgi:hypothetical protein
MPQLLIYGVVNSLRNLDNKNMEGTSVFDSSETRRQKGKIVVGSE